MTRERPENHEDALWRLQARTSVLLAMRSSRRIHPARCAAELERLWNAAHEARKQCCHGR